MGTGSHVVWNGKPLASMKKGSWAQGEVKTTEKTRAQSPKSNFWNGGNRKQEKKMNKSRFIDLFTITEKKMVFLSVP